MSESTEFYSNPFGEILELIHDLDLKPNVDENNPLFKVFKENPIPKFTQNEIETVKSSLDSAKDHLESLFIIGYSFPYVSDFYLVQKDAFLNEDLPYTTIFAFCNAITWFINTVSTKTFSNSDLVLNSLIKTTKYYPSHSFSLFSYIFKLVFDNCSKEERQKYIKILFDFISEPFSFPKGFCYLIPYIIENTLTEEDQIIDKELMDLISLAGKFALEGNIAFDGELMMEIMEKLEEPLKKLDLFTIKFFNSIENMLESDFVEEFYSDLPDLLYKCFKREKCSISWKEDEECIEFVDKDIIFEDDSDVNTFEEGICLECIDFPQVFQLEKFFADKIYNLINAIIEVYYKKKDRILEFFNDLINYSKQKTKNKAFGNILATILLMCKSLSIPIGNILEAPFFDPKVTFYSHNDNYEYIYTLRSTAIHLMLEQKNSCVVKLLKKTKIYPLLFTEINYILSQEKDLLIDYILENNDILKFMSKALSYYKHLDCKESQNKKEIKIARTSMYYLISIIVDNKKIYNLASFLPYFITVLMTIINEASLRKYGLLIFELIIKNIPEENSKFIFENYLIQINKAFKNQDKDYYSEIISSLSNSYLSRKEFIKSNLNVINEMFNLLLSLESNDCHKVILIKTFNFFITLYEFIDLDKNKITILTKTLAKVFGSDNFLDVYNLLVDYLTGNKKDKIIRVPEILKVFFNIFLDTEYFERVADYIVEVLEFSPKNSLAANKCGFDSYLLSLISDNLVTSVDKVERVLNLFRDIAVVKSSPLVVKQFVSLLSPVNNALSPYHEKYLEILMNIVSSQNEEEQSTILLGKKQIETNFETNQKLSDGLTVCFWIIFFSVNAFKDEEANIISIKANRNMFKLFVKEGKIFVKIKIGEEIIIKEVMEDMPINIWKQITIHTENEDQTTRVLCNGKEIIETKLFNIDNELAEVKIGCSNLKSKNCFVEIGTTFLTTYLTYNTVEKLYLITPHVQIPSSVEALAKYQPIKNEIKEDKSNEKESFIFSLVRIWKLDIILPLFTLFYTPLATGEILKNNPAEIISIFTKILQNNIHSQRKFFVSKKFSYIAYLLTKYPKKTLNYDIYLQFYSMYITLEWTNLKYQLLDNIILSPNVWLTTTADDHLKILSHWVNEIIKCDIMAFIGIRDFESLLNILSLFYWYSYNEETCIGKPGSERERDPDLDVDLCRERIMQCIDQIAMINFTRDNLLHLYATCKSVSYDKKQLKSLVNFSLNLILKIPSFEINLIQKEDLIPIYELAYVEEGDNSIYSLNLILALIKKNVISAQYLTDFIDVLIMSLPKKPSASFYDEVIKMLKMGITEMLNICCWYAGNHGKEETDVLINTLSCLSKTSSLTKRSNWFVRPCILAFNSTKEQRKKIFSFIISCKMDNLEDVLAYIDIMGRILDKHTDDNFRSDFLLILCNQIIDNISKVSKKDVESVIAYILTFIFFRSEQIINLGLRKMFDDSNIPIEDAKRRVSNVNTKILNGILVSTLLNTVSLNEKNYVGYRFDEEGNWLDEDLSKACLRLIFNTSSVNFYTYAYLICLIFFSKNSDFVDRFIKGFKSTSSEAAILSVLQSNKHLCLPIAEIEKLLSKLSKNFERSKNILEKVKRTQNEVTELAENMIFIGTEKESNSKNNIAIEKQKREMVNNEIEMNWNRLWSSLTEERCPWYSEVSKSVTHWKRDNTICSAFCPARLKVNKRFNDHIKASKVRDSECFEPEEVSNSNTAEEIKITNEFKDYDRHILYIPCQLVKTEKLKSGIFALSKDAIELIIGHRVKVISLSNIKYALLRTKYHKKTAIEIFTYTGKPYFINFKENSLKILKLIQQNTPSTTKVQTQMFLPYFKSLKITEAWTKGNISNFEYLMNLNIYSGRSFLDQSQYPIFPLVLIDTSSEKLDFSDKEIYRDLTKPIGALNSERLLLCKEEKADREEMEEGEGYLYSSGPVSRLTICIFLIRMEPFTTLHIDLQSGRFDVADRQLHSIKELVKSLYETACDYREYIPEFYFSPEFLINYNHFDLGKRSDSTLNDIVTPPWAKNQFEFIYFNRKALESDFVSSVLNNWIDLLWGYKQRGEEANKADNTFIPALYEDVWEKNPNTPEEQIKAYLNLIGQIPPQLFKEPHPKRKIEYKEFKNKYTNSISKDVLFVHYTEKMIITLTKDCKLIHYKEVFNNGEYSIQKDHETEIKDKDISKFFKKCNPDSFSFSSLTGNILFSQKDSTTFYVIDIKSGKVSSVLSLHQSITHISSDKHWFVTNGDENTTILYNINHCKNVVKTMRNFRDGTSCICISDNYKVVINGTKDNSLILSSMTNGSTIRVIELEGVPLKVHVTDMLGFIVVYLFNKEEMQYKIKLFTINGEEIITKNVDWRVTEWCFWTSHRGFDYIGVLSDKGDLLFAEVFYLLFEKIGVLPSKEISSLFFSKTANAINSLSKNGGFTSIPFNEPHW